MASPKKKSREELIAGGYCPICSKCTGQNGGGLDGCMLYECYKCGTLLLEVSHLRNNPGISGPVNLPHFVEVTEEWEEIWNWYTGRRDEIDNQISDLEMQLLAEVPGVLLAILAKRVATDPSQPFRGFALVKPSAVREKPFNADEWQRQRLEARGIPGVSYECETVLQQLLTWAWRRPDRWVPAICSRPTVCGGHT